MKTQRRSLLGRVLSDKMDKTVIVKVERTHNHPLYRKVVRTSKKYKVHDENNACRIGDLVMISEARPMSREKRWVVEQIVEKAEQ